MTAKPDARPGYTRLSTANPTPLWRLPPKPNTPFCDFLATEQPNTPCGVLQQPNHPIRCKLMEWREWSRGGGDGVGWHGSGVVVMTVGWRWWRVAESEYGDRVDPVVRTTFSFDRKNLSENFFDGGGVAAKVVTVPGGGAGVAAGNT
ncbi:hypothetical protein Tco_0075592 [Tanacetum coccineum]